MLVTDTVSSTLVAFSMEAAWKLMGSTVTDMGVRVQEPRESEAVLAMTSMAVTLKATFELGLK